MHVDIDIDYYDTRLNVSGTLLPGAPATRIDPADPSEWEDFTVTVGGVDITDLLDTLYERGGQSALEAVLDRAEIEHERLS